jgi:diguanylate cyclase (GGDEF)-like protein/PAS domain S-box-containing protein
MRKFIVSHLLLLMFLVGAASGFFLSAVAWWDLQTHERDTQQLYQAASDRSAAPAAVKLATAAAYRDAAGHTSAAQQRLLALSLLATLVFCGAAGVTYRQWLAHRRQSALLAREHALFKTLYQGTNDAIVLMGNGKIIDCNHTALQLFGAPSALQLACADLDALQPRRQPDGNLSAPALRARLAKPATGESFEWRFKSQSGHEFPAEVSLHTAVTGHDSVLQMTVRDISARKSAERSMRLANQAFENSLEGIAITDANGDILTINRAFTSITGYSLDEVVGRNPRVLSSGRQSRAFYVDMWNALNTMQEWHGEVWNKRKSGEIYPQWLTITEVHDEHGRITNYVGVFSDISELKAAHARNLRAVYYDTLTGLPNRALFNDRLHQLSAHTAAEPGRAMALMFMDLDRLKVVNDSMGRAAGDALLQMAAARIGQDLRASDTLARINGDEFAILLADIGGADDAVARAQAILARFEQSFPLQGEQIHVSMSIGISVFPTDGVDSGELLQNAAMAMYRAKKDDTVAYALYDQALRAQASGRLALETGLRRALERDEFELHYQPQIDCRSGTLIGFEALLRWRHPELGLVAPASFLPVAEETGLIVPIGAWVLHTACAQAQAWRNSDPTRRLIAVNLSARQLQHRDIVQHVRAALDASGLPPHCLELEITESMMMQDIDASIAVMHQLAALGVEFSIDDFGTGYSSLAYLKKMPIKALKIDQSFIRDIVTDPDGASIVSAIVALSDTLGLRVVAEGIEDHAQLAHLKNYRAIIGQGYLLGRPGPAEHHAELLAAAAGAAPAVALHSDCDDELESILP